MKPRSTQPPFFRRPAPARAASRIPPWLAPLLTMVSGYVDVIGYLCFYRVFVANMSGNHVRLGMAIAEGKAAEAVLRVSPIVAFAVGAVAGELLSGGTRRPALMNSVTRLWGCEAVALGFTTLWGATPIPDWRGLLLLGAAAFAMGLQNVSLRKSAGLTVYTTHVTGTLTTGCVLLADTALWMFRHKHRRPFGRVARILARLPSARQACWILTLPVSYLAGAVLGALAYAGVGIKSLWPAVAVLVMLIAWKLLRPAR